MQELFIIEGSTTCVCGAKQRTLWSGGGQDCFEIISTGYNQIAVLMETQHLWSPIQNKNKRVNTSILGRGAENE